MESTGSIKDELTNVCAHTRIILYKECAEVVWDVHVIDGTISTSDHWCVVQ